MMAWQIAARGRLCAGAWLPLAARWTALAALTPVLCRRGDGFASRSP